jgi:asparagine synthase (glutamine-hydrolysing)
MARLLTVENPDDNPASVLEPALRAEVTRADPFRRYREVAKSLADRDPVQMMLLADLQIILPDIFLEKVDRSTMAQSVEVRVPFLDHDLVDYVVSLPACLKVNWRQKKRLLRKALRGTVPNDILNGPKVGFGVPFSAWMRGTPADRLLDALTVSGGRAGAVLDRRNIELRVQQHRSGRRDHGFMLWKCLQLVLWLEHAASFTSSMSDHRLVPA